MSDVEHVCPALPGLLLALDHFPVVGIIRRLRQLIELDSVGFRYFKPQGSDENDGPCSNTRFPWQSFKEIELPYLL